MDLYGISRETYGLQQRGSSGAENAGPRASRRNGDGCDSCKHDREMKHAKPLKHVGSTRRTN